METFSITMLLGKETKGAIRYAEVDEAGHTPNPYILGTLYIRKTAFATTVYPQSIKVSITEIG